MLYDRYPQTVRKHRRYARPWAVRVGAADPTHPSPHKHRRQPGRRFYCRAMMLFTAKSLQTVRPKKQYVLGIRLNVQTNVVAEQVAVVQRALGNRWRLRSDVLSVYGRGLRRRRVSRSL